MTKNFSVRIGSLIVLSALCFCAQAQTHAFNSVLSSGQWYKIGVVEQGVYRLTYGDFVAMGVDVAQIDPHHVSFYGNEACMLPQRNDVPRPDDLNEMAVAFRGNDDNVFASDEYFVFYAEEPLQKIYSEQHQMFLCERNFYSDTVFYFVRTDNPAVSKRIEDADVPNADACEVVDKYLDMQHHELDLNNHYSIGTRWYGETLSKGTGKDLELDFFFADAVPNSAGKCYVTLIGRSLTEQVKCDISVAAVPQERIFIPPVTNAGNNFANETWRVFEFETLSDTFEFTASVFTDEDNTMVGIDYVTVNTWRELVHADNQLCFSVMPFQTEWDTVEVKIVEQSGRPNVWNVTSPLDVKNIMTDSDDTVEFRINVSERVDLLVFDDVQAKGIVSLSAVGNQNLHSTSGDVDMIIITHGLFRRQADELAAMHAAIDGFDCVVAEVGEIYNEFSTGRLDVAAIRDFIKMVYDRGNGRLGYVLLLGDASFDFRDILKKGGNFVPSLQSDNTYNFMSSYVTDDFFALLDDGEGLDGYGVVDVAVGRLPVGSMEQADNMVEKIKRYVLSDNQGDWKNNFLFVADDDKLDYMRACDTLESILGVQLPEFNVSKLYADAFVRQKNSGGYAYPEVNERLLGQINKGVSFLAYFGHGGVRGLTEEGVLKYNDILLMRNEVLPFFYTATCEFSKFDNPSFCSAGEELLLNPDGGSIAMLTTARPTSTFPNMVLGVKMFDALNDTLGIARFGDWAKAAKSSGLKVNLSWVLLGDPALRLDYPQKKVRTLAINGVPDSVFQNVESASMMTLNGCVTGKNGMIDSDFNGFVKIKLFDKKVVSSTLSNNGIVGVFNFSEYKDVVFEGVGLVSDGCFSTAIPVSDVLNYLDGNARLSYYAYDTTRHVDANGVHGNFTLVAGGGSQSDIMPPVMEMYCNLPSFQNGDEVSPNGTIYVFMTDEQGIYCYNNVIGRDILLTHEYNGTADIAVLNDLCRQVEAGDFSRWKMEIPFSGLPEGNHTYMLRVSDNHGNVAEKEISFVVKHTMQSVSFDVSPNPCSSSVTLSVACDTDATRLGVTVSFFTSLGQHLADVERTFNCGKGMILDLKVDFMKDLGLCPETGSYVAGVRVEDNEGNVAVGHKQIIIVR